MARLRGCGGCPWDREQDHRSLRGCLLEETYEALEAIDRGDAEELCQELGDLLLQVVFHAQIAAEVGRFDIVDVIQTLRDKLIARHPHIFGGKSLETSEQVVEQWECLKQKERGGSAGSPLDGIPKGMPALARARMALRAAAREGGAAWTAEEARGAVEAALARVGEEASEGREAEHAVGELLFAVVKLARAKGADAEQALRERVDRFIGQAVGNSAKADDRS